MKAGKEEGSTDRLQVIGLLWHSDDGKNNEIELMTFLIWFKLRPINTYHVILKARNRIPRLRTNIDACMGQSKAA